MMSTYTYPKFAYRISAEQEAGRLAHHPVVVIGAGPVGLTAALDFASRGIPTVVLDDNDTVSVGSRAVCYAKRPLEIWDRLGCAAAMVEKGISWRIGKVFFEEDLRYQFDLLPEPDHKMPAMINLQQYYLEEYLVEACTASPLVDLRWKHKLLSLQQQADAVTLTVETPDGVFTLEAEWVVACDGANSDTRRMVGADFTGQAFLDRFLIADVVMKAHFPTERWFWFDPPFHPGGSALLHRQPEDIWRIDLQLPATADAEVEKRPENVRPRIRAMLGHDDFALEWVSIYRFRCLRLERFIHGNVIFAGDAAHQVSPFGARGANSGIQDAENLGWKLAAVNAGHAPASLLSTYDLERGEAADENLAHSTRSTDFIAPQSAAERTLRDAALALAREHAFAKRMVNSGRLSTPCAYVASPLSTADDAAWPGGPPPGAPIPDARTGNGFLSEVLGHDFTWLAGDAETGRLAPAGIAVLAAGEGGLGDPEGELATRFSLGPGRGYLIRPDGHVAARFLAPDAAGIAAAHARALRR